MTDPDTSAEGVERLANRLGGTPLYEGSGEESDLPDDTAATLRALSFELEKAREKARESAMEYMALDMQALEALDRAEAAEAKLKEAVNRMEEIAHMGYDMPSTFAGTEGEWYSRRANLMQGIARAFVATLDQPT